MYIYIYIYIYIYVNVKVNVNVRKVNVIYVYMAHHFILLRLNPFDLRVGREGWWLVHSLS